MKIYLLVLLVLLGCRETENRPVVEQPEAFSGR